MARQSTWYGFSIPARSFYFVRTVGRLSSTQIAINPDYATNWRSKASPASTDLTWKIIRTKAKFFPPAGLLIIIELQQGIYKINFINCITLKKNRHVFCNANCQISSLSSQLNKEQIKQMSRPRHPGKSISQHIQPIGVQADMIGTDAGLLHIVKTAERVAGTDVAILL